MDPQQASYIESHLASISTSMERIVNAFEAITDPSRGGQLQVNNLAPVVEVAPIAQVEPCKECYTPTLRYCAEHSKELPPPEYDRWEVAHVYHQRDKDCGLANWIVAACPHCPACICMMPEAGPDECQLHPSMQAYPIWDGEG